MCVIAELTLPEPIFFGPTFEAVPSATLTIEDVHYVNVRADAVRYVCFAWVSNCSFDAFEAATDDDATLAECSSVMAFDDRALYRIVTPARYVSEDPLVFPLYREHDVTTLESWRTVRGLHLRARFPSRDVLRSFEQALTDRGATVEVDSLLPVDDDTDSVCDLTEKQREALTLAFDRGYFETPKSVTLSELAEEIGVAPQTLSHHLRVAVETIVGHAVRSAPPSSVAGQPPNGASR